MMIITTAKHILKYFTSQALSWFFIAEENWNQTFYEELSHIFHYCKYVLW
jgi:hypothetical protein